MKKVLVIMGVLLLLFLLVYIFYYNKPHKDINRASVDYEVPAEELVREFSQDESAAHDKYNGKVILVMGKVNKVSAGADASSIILIDGEGGGMINCELSPNQISKKEITEGEIVQIKGLYIGFNDLLEEIQLKKCTIEE